MSEILNILVVDGKPGTALIVIDTLRDLGHRTEVQNTGLGAINATITKRRANRPYHLVIANFDLPDIDPVEFLHSLRQHKEDVPACFYANTHDLPKEAFIAVEQMNGRFIGLPIDRLRLQSMINEILRFNRRSTEPGAASATGEGPFFGTGRITRRSSSITDAIPATNQPAPMPLQAPATRPISEIIAASSAPPLPPATSMPPVTASVSKRSTDISTTSPFPDDAPPSPVLKGTSQFRNQANYSRTPLPSTFERPTTDAFSATMPRQTSTTERHRRSITSQQPPQTGAQVPGTGSHAPGTTQQPGTGSLSATARIRRSITGKVVNPNVQPPASSTSQAKITLCSGCAKEFFAELRPAAYSLPCIYCGHMNRIDPV